jgi:hypothetical protein
MKNKTLSHFPSKPIATFSVAVIDKNSSYNNIDFGDNNMAYWTHDKCKINTQYLFACAQVPE